MSTEDIENLWASLSLTEEDGLMEVVREDLQKFGHQKVEFSLVESEGQGKGVIRGPSEFLYPLVVLEEPVGEGDVDRDVVDIDMGASGDCLGKYLRVRVMISVSMSLKRGLHVDLTDIGEKTILMLHYERLLDPCFKRGMMGNLVGEFPSKSKEDRPLLEQDFKFGS
ncbi:hypothetical protein QYF36_009467 [Acer negundo]|nr:hypothetical protein QYF36_009467 [Acer negundo]